MSEATTSSTSPAIGQIRTKEIRRFVSHILLDIQPAMLQAPTYCKAKFLKLTKAMDPKSKLSIIYLCSTHGWSIKNGKYSGTALSHHLNRLPPSIVNKAVLEFFQTALLERPIDTKEGTKLNTFNIQSGFPALDLLYWALTTPQKDLTVRNMSKRTSFSQLNLDDGMQALGQINIDQTRAMSCLWRNITDPAELESMWKQYYAELVADEALLIRADGSNVVLDRAYTLNDLDDYLEEVIVARNNVIAQRIEDSIELSVLLETVAAAAKTFGTAKTPVPENTSG